MADPDPTPTPAPEPAPEPAAAEPEKTLTQAQVDRLVQDRLARQKAQFADYDQLKEQAAKYKEFEEAQKTELQKAQELAATLEKKAADATTRAQEALLRSAVVSEAARKNVVDPDAAVSLLDKSLLEYGEDGAPTNVGLAIDALLEAKPYLAGNARPAGSADLGARGAPAPGQLTRDQLKTMSSAEIVKAQAEGRLDAVLRGDA